MPQTAKLFRNGRSQAVRLPAEFRLEGTEVEVRKDPETGDVILSPQREAKQQSNWEGLFHLLDELGPIEEEFLSERDATPPEVRELL